ncbi:MAG TPA: ATP-binding protein, partial [Cyclobacteriaceae bacterium]|nr:ATP-binding protein [Cyclobacteriaceae bacterium]
LPQPKFKSVQLKDLIERVAQLMKVELKNTGIELQYHCRPDTPPINADEEMIEQVLINLVKNSIEALSQMVGGKINLSLTHKDSFVIVDVTDNGSGIIPEAIERVFVPFFTTKKAGSGIGLALSRQIMQLHNGTLTVKSEPYVKTVFRLKF